MRRKQAIMTMEQFEAMLKREFLLPDDTKVYEVDFDGRTALYGFLVESDEFKDVPQKAQSPIIVHPKDDVRIAERWRQ